MSMDAASRPADNLVSITPSDSANVSLRALYVGVSGDVQITDYNGNTVVLVGLAAGVFHPVGATRVWSTNTSATNIVGAKL